MPDAVSDVAGSPVASWPALSPSRAWVAACIGAVIASGTAIAAVIVAVRCGAIPRTELPVQLSLTSCEYPSRAVFTVGFTATAGFMLASIPTVCQGISPRLIAEEYVPEGQNADDARQALAAGLSIIGILGALGLLVLAVVPLSRGPHLQNSGHGMGAIVFFNAMHFLFVTVTAATRADPCSSMSLVDVMPAVIFWASAGFAAGYDWPRTRMSACKQWGMLTSIIFFTFSSALRMQYSTESMGMATPASTACTGIWLAVWIALPLDVDLWCVNAVLQGCSQLFLYCYSDSNGSTKKALVFSSLHSLVSGMVCFYDMGWAIRSCLFLVAVCRFCFVSAWQMRQQWRQRHDLQETILPP